MTKKSFKRRFWDFTKWVQRGYFGIWDMRIYCRGVEIVFLLRIHIALPLFVRAVDGPQLAWEQSAIKPLSGRYHPRSSRSSEPFCTARSAARLFVRRAFAIYLCIFSLCLYSVIIITIAFAAQYINVMNNVNCNAVNNVWYIFILLLIYIVYYYNLIPTWFNIRLYSAGDSSP